MTTPAPAAARDRPVTQAVNYWPDTKCAKAFWGQHDLPPYRELLDDTVDWADPKPGESWLDLGCGGGAPAKAPWGRSQGPIAQGVGPHRAAVHRQGLAQTP